MRSDIVDHNYPKYRIVSKFAWKSTPVMILSHDIRDQSGELKMIRARPDRIRFRKYWYIEERLATLAGYFYEKLSANYQALQDAEDVKAMYTRHWIENEPSN